MERRNSLRYPGHAYTEPGPYFVTICVERQMHLFGQVALARVQLTPAGGMVQASLLELPNVIRSIALDSFVVMPNHVHALMFLGVDANVAPTSLGAIVRRFKSLTTTRYIDGVKRDGWARFEGRLWQRDYYDHIVRSDRGVERVRD